MSSYKKGQIHQLANKLEGEEGAERFLRDELEVCEPKRLWREQDGVIYLSVTSDGTTGSKWIERLEKKGFRMSNYVKSILHSPDFKPTNGITTEIVVLKGMLFNDDERITKKIRTEANRRNLTEPNAEVACLIRETFSDKEIEAMGLWWVIAMHKPIKDSDGDLILLGAYRSGVGCWLDAYCADPVHRWSHGNGFAFVVSQVGTSD